MMAEKDRQLFDIFAVVEIANIVLSFIINAFLLWAVMRKSKDLGSYRYLLLAFTLNDIYFPLVHALTLPIICSYGNAFIMFSHGFLNSKFSVCLFAASHSQAMPIMANLFIYRLVALKWPHLLRFYTVINTSLLVLLSVFAQQNLWFWNCWFSYNSDQELRDYLKPFLDRDFPGEGIGHIGALSVGNTRSNKTERLQRQLFRTLVLQMVIPLFCVYLPCAFIINLPILFHISVFPNLVSAALTFFPVIDALITIFGVKNYRSYLLSFFCKAQIVNSTTIPSSQKRNSAI